MKLFSKPVVAQCALLLALPAWAQKDSPDNSDDKKLFTSLCGSCHNLSMVTSRRANRDEWQKTIEAMIAKGADGTDEEFMKVLDYLTKNYGPDKPGGQRVGTPVKVNINTASPEAITSSLGASDADAASIVQYRDAHGPFKSWPDLAKVPNLDTKKLEPMKDRIVFH